MKTSNPFAPVTRSALGFPLCYALAMWLVLNVALCAAPIDLLSDGGFEDPEQINTRPGWEVRSEKGGLETSRKARTGKYAVRFQARPTAWGYSMFQKARGHAATTHGIEVQAGATYRLTIWARGHGRATLLVGQWSSTFLGSDFFEDTPPVQLTDEWQPIRVIYTPTDPRVRRAVFSVRLLGDDAEAWFDDASFVFDPAANPTIELNSRERPTLPVVLQRKTRDAQASWILNGVVLDGTGPQVGAVLREGLNVLEVDARRTGDDPGLRVNIEGFPETATRWRIHAGEEAPEQSHAAAFDDSDWAVVTPHGDEGWLWDAGDSEHIRLRQVILWNATHHRGPNRWIIPPMAEWGFPQGAMELFQVVLHSPLPLPFDDAEFILEVPRAFRLMALDDHPLRQVMNVPADSVAEELVASPGGEALRRYRIRYHAKHVRIDRGHYALWPVRMDTALHDLTLLNRILNILWPVRRDTALPVGETVSFSFRRLGRGNFTELPQHVPVRVLPPINGRQPQHIRIGAYHSIPGIPSFVSHELMDALAEQSTAAGFNQFTIIPYLWGASWEAHTRRWHDAVIRHGARVVFWPPFNYPMKGAWLPGHVGEEGAVYQWALRNPEARARYFRDSETWAPKDRHLSDLCPSFAIEHANEFEAALRTDYARMRTLVPDATIMFQDFEQHAWTRARGDLPAGHGSRCFCDRCKRAFAETIGWPSDTELPDEVILRDHSMAWDLFWNRRYAAMLEVTGRAGRELGMEYMLYTWAKNHKFWKAAAPTLDILFVGMPGDHTADSEKQSGMDQAARFYREELGVPMPIGQRHPFYHIRGPDRNYPASGNVKVTTHSGFFEPASWKNQVLRVVTALGGGINLENPDKWRGGALYYIGEATRILAAFEPFFLEGQRRDETIASDDLVAADRLALEHNGQRLILLFNETDTAKTVRITLQDVPPDASISRFESDDVQPVTEAMAWEIPPHDVTVLHVTVP